MEYLDLLSLDGRPHIYHLLKREPNIATQTPKQASIYQAYNFDREVSARSAHASPISLSHPCQPYDQCSSSPAQYGSPSTSRNCGLQTARFGDHHVCARTEGPWSIKTRKWHLAFPYLAKLCPAAHKASSPWIPDKLSRAAWEHYSRLVDGSLILSSWIA